MRGLCWVVALACACAAAGCNGDDDDVDGGGAVDGGAEDAGGPADGGGAGDGGGSAMDGGSAVDCDAVDAGGAVDGGGSCPGFQACGGDLEGEWNLDAVCFDDPESLFATQLGAPECDDVFSDADVRASGSYRFADGTSTTELTVTVDMAANWTEECLSAVNDGALIDLAQACPMIESNYLAQGTFESAVCTLEADVCACRLTTAAMTSESSGTYRIECNELIDELDGDRTPYCVSGDTLTLRVTSNSLGGTITLSR